MAGNSWCGQNNEKFTMNSLFNSPQFNAKMVKKMPFIGEKRSVDNLVKDAPRLERYLILSGPQEIGVSQGILNTRENFFIIGSVEILTIFLSTLLGATARNAFAPAAVASPLE